ncbi:MAG: hypothetical protein HOI97_01195 [Oceanospirillales bacterium]|jgi:hypothetical protein|nr:hypothetical protein [Oceanospirillales bacterium]MDG1157028.1 hypothetical protein [Litorivicinaceae bacterium]
MELSLCIPSAEDLARYVLGFGLRPALFIPGQFDASIVGGVHPLEIRVDGMLVIHTQVRIFFIAPAGVIEPFVPGIGASLVLDHAEFFAQIRLHCERNPQIAGTSLLQCSPEEIHDRFTLSSRLY